MSSSSKHGNFFLLTSFLLFLLSNKVNLSLRCNPQLHKFGISMGVLLQQPEEEVFQVIIINYSAASQHGPVVFREYQNNTLFSHCSLDHSAHTVTCYMHNLHLKNWNRTLRKVNPLEKRQILFNNTSLRCFNPFPGEKNDQQVQPFFSS